MNAAPLVLAWLVLAHLLADFVFQTQGVAIGKFGNDRRAWRALAIHVGIVGLLNLPLIVVFGVPGAVFAAVVTGAHLVIDRAKIDLTIRTAGGAPSGAGSGPPGAPLQPGASSSPTSDGPAQPDAPPSPVGPSQPDAPPPAASEGPALDQAWTSRPAALFIADQLAHVAVLVGAWAILLAGAAPLGAWVDFVNRLLGSTDPAAFHRAVLVLVVLADLAIVNVRAASLFVATLVRAPRPRLDRANDRATDHAADRAGTPSEARIGATIGVLERIIVAALTLASALDAIGLVVAAKTLARFRQLDDREFAEYYLLGTLASISVAIISSLIARQALA